MKPEALSLFYGSNEERGALPLIHHVSGVQGCLRFVFLAVEPPRGFPRF